MRISSYLKLTLEYFAANIYYSNVTVGHYDNTTVDVYFVLCYTIFGAL